MLSTSAAWTLSDVWTPRRRKWPEVHWLGHRADLHVRREQAPPSPCQNSPTFPFTSKRSASESSDDDSTVCCCEVHLSCDQSIRRSNRYTARQFDQFVVSGNASSSSSIANSSL